MFRLHVGEPLEVGLAVDPLAQPPRQRQVALDHLPVAGAAVGAERGPDVRARERRELSGARKPKLGRGSSGRGR